MTKYAYLRVSTEDQLLDSQRIEILAAHPDVTIFEEHASGKNMERPELQRMLALLVAGDIVVVHRLDRISRSLADLIGLLESFKEKNVSFISVHDAIDTTTTTGRLMAGMLGTIAQYFRELTSERVKEGLKAAKARGVKLGNPHPKGRVSKFNLEECKKMKELSAKCSIASIARSYKVSRITVYRMIEKYNEHIAGLQLPDLKDVDVL